LYDVVVPPFSIKNVKTGITMEIPWGFFGLLKEKGRSNFIIGAGVVDQNYQGEIIFKIFNPTNEPVTFIRGQQIGQMIFIPIIRPDIAVYSLEEIHKEETERGNTGGILEQS
jgi:dUTPase